MTQSRKDESDVKLHTVIIETTRMVVLSEFYSQGLDLGEASPTGDNHLGFSLKTVYFGFDLVDRELKNYPGAISLWFEVNDLEATFNRFLELGARVKYPPTRKPWGGVLAAVFDPDGNIVGLAQRGTITDK